MLRKADYKKIKEGTTVVLRPDFGMGKPIEVKITDVDLEGKNGRPIVGYFRSEDDERWAYFDQIDRIVKEA